tara:strand:- start:39 stop:359 length:321 start_codon:yes stop_codon:yes gene_type:complete
MATALSENEINDFLGNQEFWILRNKRLFLKIKFSNFTEAFSLITEIALISETINHHPEWSNCYGNISIELYTHDQNCLTSLDLQLASLINKLILKRDRGSFENLGK